MSVDFSRENLASLTRDGISEELFKLLWAKDELNFSPAINIPDTILYKYGQPITWYFTATDGRIKRKNKHNIVSAKIEQAFNKHILGYDVIAYFISMPSELDVNRHNEIPTVIEYFDRAALNNFLYNHKKDVNGILQRFIEPKTTHNEVIRAIWSPKLCLLERAENKHALHDARYGLYERTVVYEGPEYYYTAEPLRGPVLSGQIQKLCEAVVAHIGEVTYGQKQVSRIVFNFKVDSRDKVWFLYTTSIRSVDMLEYNPLSGGDTMRRSLVNIDSVVSLADSVHLNPKKTYEKIVPKSLKTCLSCAKETLEDARHPVTYKQIMKHYEHVLLILQSSSSALHGNKKEGTIIWPPDQEVLQATGNVGFGCMQLDNDEAFHRPGTSSSPSKHHSHSAPSTSHGFRRTTTLKQKKLRDVVIPPILSYLHTKLSPDTFERCKSDPLFQNKTVLVCEDCYLVYAEFATMMLRMGENLKKLLLPDPRQLDATSSMLSGTSTAATNHRPSSADWRAISTAAFSSSSQTDGLPGASRTGLRSRHEREAKDRAIGLRSSDTRHQPVLPSMVRSASDSASITQGYTGYTGHNGYTGSNNGYTNGYTAPPSMISETSLRHTSSSPVPFRGGRLEQESLLSTTHHHQPQQQLPPPPLSSSTTDINHTHESFAYDPQAVHSLIAERERQFFKEISLNPQLRDHHPLQHLLHAQQKLKLVDEQSGVLMNKTAQQNESIFGTRYGKQAKDQHHRYGMYTAEVPYALHGEVILPSQLKLRNQQKLQAKRRKKQEALQKFLEQQRKDEEAQMEALHRQLQEKDAAADKARHTSKTGSGSVASAAAMDPAVVSSQHYRDFLKESLHKITAEMSTAQQESQSVAVQQARQELVQQQQQQQQESGVAVSRGSRSLGSMDSRNGKGSLPQMAPSGASVTSTTSSLSRATTQSQATSQRSAKKEVVVSPVKNKTAVSSSDSAPASAKKAKPTTTTTMSSTGEEATTLPSNRYQRGVSLGSVSQPNPSGDVSVLAEDDVSRVSHSVAGEHTQVNENETHFQQQPLLDPKDTKDETPPLFDQQAPLWSVSVGEATTTTAVVADTTAEEEEDNDGVSFAGSLSQIHSLVSSLSPDKRDTQQFTDDTETHDKDTVAEDHPLVPGGHFEDHDDHQTQTSRPHLGLEEPSLDQQSVDQMSLGHSVVDMDGLTSPLLLMPASGLQQGSSTSLTAEASITSGTSSSMRLQTDALLQMTTAAAEGEQDTDTAAVNDTAATKDTKTKEEEEKEEEDNDGVSFAGSLSQIHSLTSAEGADTAVDRRRGSSSNNSVAPAPATEDDTAGNDTAVNDTTAEDAVAIHETVEDSNNSNNINNNNSSKSAVHITEEEEGKAAVIEGHESQKNSDSDAHVETVAETEEQ